MFGLVKMFAGVFILRRVTAAHVAAFEAETEVDPGVARVQAFLTTFGRVRLDVVNVIKMGAGFHFSMVQLLIEDKAT